MAIDDKQDRRSSEEILCYKDPKNNILQSGAPKGADSIVKEKEVEMTTVYSVRRTVFLLTDLQVENVEALAVGHYFPSATDFTHLSISIATSRSTKRKMTFAKKSLDLFNLSSILRFNSAGKVA